jgi:hypothetical protein
VDLSDGDREYSAHVLDNDPYAFIMMILRFARANEESERKRDRLEKAYREKREKAANGVAEPFSRMLPAWLRWDDNERRHVVIEERAAVLKDIFVKADAGWGQHRIAQALNTAGVETFGMGKRKARYWHRSYVRKLLTNSAVVGTFTPHRKLTDERGKRKREPQDAIPNYWPAVIEREVFDRVAARMGATAARGRHAGREPASIFAGIIKCCYCGGTVTRVTKGRWWYLVCAKAHAKAGCKYEAVRYGNAEAAILGNAREIIDEAPRGSTAEDIENEIIGQEGVIEELREKVDALVDELAENRSEAVRRSLRDAEGNLKTAQADLRQLRAQRETLAAPAVRRKLGRLREALTANPINVGEANAALKEALERIVMDPMGSRLELYWRHAQHHPGRDYVFLLNRHSKMFDEQRPACEEAAGLSGEETKK